MDNIIETNTGTRQNGFSYRHVICFVCLILILGITAVVASELTKDITQITKLSYYKRYTNGGDVINVYTATKHFFDAVTHSLPTLIQLSVLFVLSFSPFLIPVSVIVTILRGFMIGCAMNCVRGTFDMAQLCVYALCAVFVCFMGAMFLKKDLRVSGKIFLFFLISGLCVTAEFILSFVL